MSSTAANPKRIRIRKCSVLNCTSNSLDKTNISYHKFPAPNGRSVYISDYFGNKRKVDQLTAWTTVLKIRRLIKSMTVCSLHFKKEDYYFPDLPTQKLTLIPDAVPSRNLPDSNEEKLRRDNNRLTRRLDRQKKIDLKCQGEKENSLAMEEEINNIDATSINHVEDCICTLLENSEAPVTESNDESNDEVNEDTHTVFSCSSVRVETDIESNEQNINQYSVASTCVIPDNSEQVKPDIGFVEENGKQDFGVQVDKKYRFFDRIKNDQRLSTATGIPSFEILNVIVNSMKLVTKNRFEKETVTMNTEDRVLMVYVKLKHNVSYSLLALIFDCITEQHCRRVFLKTVRILSPILKLAIPWPSKDQLHRNIPMCFEGLEDTRVVLDCTEIFIQRPKNLCCQVLTYSHYKGSQTAKFMTGVTPGGNVSYVSKPYGGRTSDSAIFEQSDLINLLEPGDTVMVDRGFLIEELCKKNQFKFIRPPFLKDKKQFSEEESILTAKITKARVHVERSNQRIKVFKILGSVMPVALVPYLEDIFITICGTVNLCSPILSDDKFMKTEIDKT